MAVNNHHRPKSTGAEAIYCFQCKFFIFGCLACFYTELLLKFCYNPRCPPNMTSGAETRTNKVLTFRLQAKKSVKRCYSIYINKAAPRLLAYNSECILGKKPKFRSYAMPGLPLRIRRFSSSWHLDKARSHLWSGSKASKLAFHKAP